MITYMYKVTVIDREMGTSSICLFQNKRDVEDLKAISEQKGFLVSVSKWQWRVEIEESM